MRFKWHMLLFVGCLLLLPTYENYQYKQHAKSVVMLIAPSRQAGGTGFVLRFKDRNYTITNGHVCELGAQEGFMLVVSPLLGIRRIEILEISKKTDLCILQAAPLVPALSLGSANLRRGDYVSIVGHPLLGPIHNSLGAVSSPLHWIEVIISEVTSQEDRDKCSLPKNRVKKLYGLIDICELYVKAQGTTAIIKPGNSGSPVFDRLGNVRGVAFAANNVDQKAEIIPFESLNRFLRDHYAHQYR